MGCITLTFGTLRRKSGWTVGGHCNLEVGHNHRCRFLSGWNLSGLKEITSHLTRQIFWDLWFIWHGWIDKYRLMGFLKSPDVRKIYQNHFSGIVWITKTLSRGLVRALAFRTIYCGNPSNGMLCDTSSRSVSTCTALFNCHGGPAWLSDSPGVTQVVVRLRARPWLKEQRSSP